MKGTALELDWDRYIEIAGKFQRKAKTADREDLRQDIILRLAEVASNNGHEPFNEGAMVRVAAYVCMSYWRDLMRKPNTLSLEASVDDGLNETTELWQTLADNVPDICIHSSLEVYLYTFYRQSVPISLGSLITSV